MINFKYGEKEYTLTFTRQTASDAERAGFVFDKEKMENLPVTSIMILEAYSFKANHPEVTEDEALNIISKLKGKDKQDNDTLVNALMKEYSNAIETLMSGFDESKNGIEWTVA